MNPESWSGAVRVQSFIQACQPWVILSLWAAPLKEQPCPCMSLHGLGCIHMTQGYCIVTQNYHFLGLFFSSGVFPKLYLNQLLKRTDRLLQEGMYPLCEKSSDFCPNV